ncbi:MAG: GumC family protein [Candidatus Hodarchaeota archaeon]
MQEQPQDVIQQQTQPLVSRDQIRRVLYVSKKHKWKMISVFLLIVTAAVVGSLLVTPIFHASSRLLVKPGREDVYVSPTPGAPALITRLDQKVNTEIAILVSPLLLAELVDTFGVDRLFDFPDRTFKGWISEKGILRQIQKSEIPPTKKVYRYVQNSLSVSSSGSSVIKISFYWPDPVIAARVVNTLVDLYFVQRVKVHTDPHTYNLLKDQAEKWEKKLKESEKNLEIFKNRHSLTSLPEQKTMILSKLSELESQRKRTESEIKETEGMIASLQAQMSNLDRDTQLQEMVNREAPILATLKAKLVELELQGLKEEINRVKQMIADEEKKERAVVVSGGNPIHQSLQDELLRAKVRLEGLKAKEKSQKLQTAAYPNELKTLDGLEKQMRELERQVAINEANYKLYLTKFEEAKILESMDRQKITSVSVIEPAMPTLRPIKPKKRKIVMIGGVLGLFAAIGMAFFTESINPVFRTREDVAQFLNLPVLATLPKEK